MPCHFYRIINHVENCSFLKTHVIDQWMNREMDEQTSFERNSGYPPRTNSKYLNNKLQHFQVHSLDGLTMGNFWTFFLSALFLAIHSQKQGGSLSQISHLPFQQLICYSNFLLYTNQNCHTFEALLWQLLLNIWIPSSLFSVPSQLLLLPCKGQYEGLTSKSIPSIPVKKTKTTEWLIWLWEANLVISMMKFSALFYAHCNCVKVLTAVPRISYYQNPKEKCFVYIQHT